MCGPRRQSSLPQTSLTGLGPVGKQVDKPCHPVSWICSIYALEVACHDSVNAGYCMSVTEGTACTVRAHELSGRDLQGRPIDHVGLELGETQELP